MITRRYLHLFSAVALACASAACAQSPEAAEADRDARHQSLEWLTVEPHLPDSQTGSAASLEVAADVLRARRLPEDALDYYRFALRRGGDAGRLQNRIGVTLLELRQPLAARASFQQALSSNRKDAEAWNNLGAAEYMLGNFQSSIFDYLKAVKLDRKAAIYHSNLGTSYFERKDYEGARSQFTVAFKLDPLVFQRGGWGGVEAHVMSPQDRGRFCFEMARLAATGHSDPNVLLWLARATEAGYDIHEEMQGRKEFVPYLHDERVATIVRNAKAMRGGQVAAATPVPPLPGDAGRLN